MYLCKYIHKYMHTYIHTCMHACMYIYIHIYINIYIYTHKYLCVCALFFCPGSFSFSNLYIDLYVNIYIYIQRAIRLGLLSTTTFLSHNLRKVRALQQRMKTQRLFLGIYFFNGSGSNIPTKWHPPVLSCGL